MTPTPAPKGQDIELAPCPFCGGEAQTDFIEGESYLIECYACRAETGIKDSEDEAIEAWNRRTEPSSTSTSQGVDIDAHPLADALYNRGYRDAWQERDQDARGCEEWQTVVDAIEGAAPGDALDAARCGNCKHWSERKEFEEGHSIGLGECTKVPMLWYATEWIDDDDEVRRIKAEFIDVKAFACDGSGYMAEILTKPDFGCVSFAAIATSTAQGGTDG